MGIALAQMEMSRCIPENDENALALIRAAAEAASGSNPLFQKGSTRRTGRFLFV